MSLGVSPTAVVDAHHHLWWYTPHEFDWIDDRMAALRQDFTATDLACAMDTAAVDYAVAVQARQSLQETQFLLSEAAASARIAGIVAWLPLQHAQALDNALAVYAGNPLLCGAREIVQAEPAGFLDARTLDPGLTRLTDAGIPYDLLLRADQLPEATRLVDRHPQQRFVLDHMAKPPIAAGGLEPWRSRLRALARRPHVSCKLSGMVTEDNWSCWSEATLKPYLDAAVEAFGPERLMAGSDWPVCLVASSYTRWWSTLNAYFSAFSAQERAQVFGGNAIRFYRLQTAAAGQ